MHELEHFYENKFFSKIISYKIAGSFFGWIRVVQHSRCDSEIRNVIMNGNPIVN